MGSVTLQKSPPNNQIQKHPAGAGMERVGVSNSLLGTYEQHWDLPVILSLAMMKNV
jgi:hypothetical protein